MALGQILIDLTELVHRLDAQFAVLERLSAVQTLILERIKKLEGKMEELERLTTEVTEVKTIAKSAVVLIEGIAEQIRLFKDQPAKLAALADSLDATSTELAAAVAANTPTVE